MKSVVSVKTPIMTAMLVSMLSLMACSEEKPPVQTAAPVAQPVQTAASDSTQVVAETEQPEAETEIEAQPEATDESADDAAPAKVEAATIAEGKALYDKTCKICHDTGMLDSPKLSNKTEWQKRLNEKGIDTLHIHSAKGFNKMPAQAVDGVTEAQVYAAVDYMIEQTK